MSWSAPSRPPGENLRNPRRPRPPESTKLATANARLGGDANVTLEPILTDGAGEKHVDWVCVARTLVTPSGVPAARGTPRGAPGVRGTLSGAPGVRGTPRGPPARGAPGTTT